MEHQSSKTKTIIRPPQGWLRLDLRRLWRYRDLIYYLTVRDIKAVYKQTIIGPLWAVIQPVATMVVFTIFFGNLARVDSNGIPYPIFSYTALVPWTYFANSLTKASNSLVIGAQLLKRVYFPRLIMPLSAALGGLVDFVLALVILLAMMFAYGYWPTMNLLWLPLLLLLAVMSALGMGLWLSALNIQYRDVKYVIPFLVQVWLFITPVIYPSSNITPSWRLIYGLNPMAGVIEGFRWALLGGEYTFPGELLFTGSIVALLLMVTGMLYFGYLEKQFADVA